MQRLAIEQRQRLGPRAPWHPGDIAWGLWMHEGREHEWRIRTWGDDAWSWLHLDTGVLEVDVRHDRRDLLDEILADSDAREAWAFDDDDAYRAALARHGFARPGQTLHFNVLDLATPPPVDEGFRLRTVGEDDLDARVAVHQAAWHPSRVTATSYANVRRAWPYRASLDCVAEAPDGGFAASALLWPDDENGVGELEPVGVDPRYRRRGYGAAVCAYALRRWHEEGGRQAIVYCMSDEACALYASLGFTRHATLVSYRR
jgi:ribosomal protein S18 acetylase RimI-like enzyme